MSNWPPGQPDQVRAQASALARSATTLGSLRSNLQQQTRHVAGSWQGTAAPGLRPARAAADEALSLLEAVLTATSHAADRYADRLQRAQATYRQATAAAQGAGLRLNGEVVDPANVPFPPDPARVLAAAQVERLVATRGPALALSPHRRRIRRQTVPQLVDQRPEQSRGPHEAGRLAVG